MMYYSAGSGFQPQEMELKEGTFALFLSGQYNTATRKAFKGAVNKGSCASYVSFHNMTHFGMNDFVGPSEETHQVRLLDHPLQYALNLPKSCS